MMNIYDLPWLTGAPKTVKEGIANKNADDGWELNRYSQ